MLGWIAQRLAWEARLLDLEDASGMWTNVEREPMGSRARRSHRSDGPGLASLPRAG